MKSVLKFFIISLMISFPLSLNSQVKIDLNKKVITIDKNAKANVKKDVPKDQGKDVKQNQGTQDKQVTSEKKDNKSSEELKTNTDSKSATQDQQSLQTFSKYDFIPGEKVILFDDFSQDAVGDFPALWTANAAGEINTLSIAPGNWFNLNSTDGNYFLLKNVDFPKNFIIEFDIVPKQTGGRIAAGLILYSEDKYKEMDNNPHPGNSGIIISVEKAKWNTMGYKSSESTTIDGSSAVNPVEPEKVNHVIIWVQNRRLRIYHKSAKVLDMPTNLFDGTKLNRFCFRLSRGASGGSYISNFRITDASPDMRSKLLTDGKLVTYGIYFDVNKDVIKPESYGTLKGIADILKENADVKVKIVGHTDSDGADAANMDLSKRRGASVKDALIKEFAIDAARLQSDGMGETQPIAPNDTPVNKALNRRVELLKL
jgi:outer membrane protein OmpA-like peptidoglycan-associated protein